MLQEIERDPPVGVQGDDFAVYEGAGWESLAGLSDLRELGCEKISSPGPERYPAGIPPGKTAVAVKLDLVEPSLSFRQVVDRLAYTGSMN